MSWLPSSLSATSATSSNVKFPVSRHPGLTAHVWVQALELHRLPSQPSSFLTHRSRDPGKAV